MSNRVAHFDLVVAALLAVSPPLAGTGCAPRSDLQGSSPSYSQKSPLELECERELLYLDRLIESRRRDTGVDAAALAEAVELRRSVMDLMLDEEYELALELIDEAVAILTP